MGSYFFVSSHSVYTSEMIEEMKELKVYQEVDQQNYSKTLEMAIQSDLFMKEKTKEYEQIIYQDEEDFIKHVNLLLQLQYSGQEINEIYEFLNEKNREKLLELPKLDLKKYYTIGNFEVDKINAYEMYQNLHSCSLEEAVLKVNIGLDHDFYTQIQEAVFLDDYTVLVNKYHSLGDYEPSDLEPLSYDSKYKLRKEARDAFEKLVSGAELDGVHLRPYSAYRSYAYQSSIYNTYVNRDGQYMADTYSARPGHSEHQTGLAVDVWSIGCNYIKEEDAKWLRENSYQYGFIVRYTKENKEITGYIEEPWHLRYLGVSIATDVVDKNLTYDAYYDLYLK